MSEVKAVPDGCNTVNVYLVVPNSVDAMALYEKALGARTVMRMPGPDGESTMHAEIQLGNSTIMLTDENPEYKVHAPATLGGVASSLHLYVEDVDAVFAQAVTAGFEVMQPVMDMFWGDRFGKLVDPYGHQWSIATQKEIVPPEEMSQRMQDFYRQMAQEQDD